MRRIVIALAGTVTGLVLLFSYPTSQGQTLTSTDTDPDAAAKAEPTSDTETMDDAAEPDVAESETPSDGEAAAAAEEPAATAEDGSDSGTYTGDVVDTRFGPVQVEIVVADGVITSADAIQFPTGHESDQINAYAVPILNAETLDAQSADLSLISGATYTSRAYATSLQSALDQAGL